MPKTASKNQSGVKKQQEMNLHDLLVIKLKALYDVENQLVKVLPKMAKKAGDEDLRRGFERHARQTQEHVSRLERSFSELEVKPQKLQSEEVRGIMADGDWVMKNIKGAAAIDAALIAAGQYAEHYEMAGYQSAIAWAKLLDQDDVADLLQETLDEEKETSDELTELANSKIDEEAAQSRKSEDEKNEKNHSDEGDDEKNVEDDNEDEDEDEEIEETEEGDEEDEEA